MMKPEELNYLEVLRTVDAFQELKIEQLRKLALIAVAMQFDRDEIVYEAGEVGQGIYIVQSGEVVIEMEMADYVPVTLYTIGPGELFGWSSLFETRRKRARARTLAPTKTIFLSAGKLQDLFSRDHNLEDTFRNCITAIIADRLYATRQKLAHFAIRAD